MNKSYLLSESKVKMLDKVQSLVPETMLKSFYGTVSTSSFLRSKRAVMTINIPPVDSLADKIMLYGGITVLSGKACERRQGTCSEMLFCPIFTFFEYHVTPH